MALQDTLTPTAGRAFGASASTSPAGKPYTHATGLKESWSAAEGAAAQAANAAMAKRQASVNWVNSQRGAKPIAPVGMYDKIPVIGRPLSAATDFLTPAVGMAKGLAASGGKILSVLPAEGKKIAGEVTGNKVATQHAQAQGNAAVKEAQTQVTGLAQMLPRAGAQIGLSLNNPLNILHESGSNRLLGTDRSYTPHGAVAKFLLGDQPVQSLHNVYNQDKAESGSTAHALGATALNSINDILAFEGGKKTVEAPGKYLDKALNDYNGLRAQAAISQLPPDQLALPAPKGEAPLALPERSVTNPVKQTPGPNGGTFGGNPVSDATAHRLSALDQAVATVKNGGDTIDHAQKLSDIANLRDRAAEMATSLVQDHAKLLQDLHKQTGGTSLIKEDGMVTGRVSSNDPFYAKVFKETGKPPKAADWLNEAKRQLSTGSDPAAKQYQTVTRVIDQAHQVYADKLGSAKVSDIYKQSATPEQTAALESRLQAVKEQAAREVAGQNQGAQIEQPKPTVSADTLRQNLANLENGKSAASHIQALNDLIQHPDTTAAEKKVYIEARESLKPSEHVLPKTVAKAEAKAVATAEAAPRSHAIADTFNPNEKLARPEDVRPLPKAISSVVPEATTKDAALNAGQFVASKTRDLQGTLADAIHTPDANGKLLTEMTARDQKLLEGIERGPKTYEGDTARIERIAKTADNPAQFRAVVEANKAIQDRLLAGDRAIPGREDIAQIANHLPRNGHDFVDANGKPITKGNPEAPTGDGTPGYAKQRVFNTIAEKEAYRGPNGEHFVRNSSGIIEDIQNQIKAAAVNHGAAATAKGLQEAYPDQISVGRATVGAPTQLRIPGLDHVYAAKDLAAELNQRAQAGEAGFFGSKYDTVNQGAKELGFMGGLFHGATTATSVAGEQLMRAIQHPSAVPQILGDNLHLIGSTFSPKLHDAMVEELSNNHAANPDNLSSADRYTLAGGTARAESGGSADVVAKTGVSRLESGKYNPLGAAKEAVFGRQIPDAKMMIFDQATKGLDSRIPEDFAKMQEAAKAVNKLGNLNKLTQGMTPTLSKWFGRVWISPDYTQGRALTWKSALTDFHSPAGEIARNTIIGKTVVSSAAVLAYQVATGKLNLNDGNAVKKAVIASITDPAFSTPWMGAPTKTNPGGTPQAVHLPTTFISEFTKIIMPALQLNAPDRTSGVKDYLSARLAKVPALGEELATNSDYFGQHIYGTDKNGNPISPGQTAFNVANQVLPIPAVQASKAAFSGQGVAQSLLNTAGLRVAADKTSPQAAKTAAEEDQFNAFASTSPISKQHSTVVKAANAAMDANDYPKYVRIVNQWNNVTLPSLVKPLQNKYPNYTPTTDQNYTKLRLSPKQSAFFTRGRNSAKAKQTQAQFQ